jgi:hypothetical protein
MEVVEQIKKKVIVKTSRRNFFINSSLAAEVMKCKK